MGGASTLNTIPGILASASYVFFLLTGAPSYRSAKKQKRLARFRRNLDFIAARRRDFFAPECDRKIRPKRSFIAGACTFCEIQFNGVSTDCGT
jgi:hypothetical protein